MVTVVEAPAELLAEHADLEHELADPACTPTRTRPAGSASATPS